MTGLQSTILVGPQLPVNQVTQLSYASNPYSSFEMLLLVYSWVVS